MLDMGFEMEGFTVVKGPDLIWGGDIHGFNPPSNKFNCVIGGPPCQAHSRYAGINRALGNQIAPDLIPEFCRVVKAAQPDCFVMENVADVPDVKIDGYEVTRNILDNRWLGLEQARRRVFQFGARAKRALQFTDFGLESQTKEPTCLASEGASGRISFSGGKSKYTPRREFERFLELQGLPVDFLKDSPFTATDKYRLVGNGVPIPMGRCVAKAIKEAMNWV